MDETNREKLGFSERLNRLFSSKKFRICKEIGLVLLAFFLALLCFIILYASLGFAPFAKDGKLSLMLDQRDQYLSYLRYYQSVLQSGQGSMIYTLSKVFGGDFMSIFTYYLASPFNLFVAFLTPSDIPSFFLISSIVKLSIGAMNFYLLCRFHFQKGRFAHVAFAVAYGLMTYNVVYISNFMYMDVLMMLPLVILGILYLEKGKHHWLYLLSLGYCLWTSWYLGAMVCIFAVLFFCVRLFYLEDFKANWLRFVVRFALTSLLAGLLTGAIWVTAFLHFEGTKATSGMPKSEWYPLTLFFSGLLENNYFSQSNISRNEGYMTMFVGMPALVYALLFFANVNYTRKQRLAEAALFLVLLISSIWSIPYALWHGGRMPSWFPTRFSFLTGFLVCFLAAKEATHVEKTVKLGLVLPGAAAIVVLPILFFTDNNLNLNNLPNHYSLSFPSLGLYLGTYALAALHLFLTHERKVVDKIAPALPYVKVGFSLALLIIATASSYRGAYQIVSANLENGSYYSSMVYDWDCELEPIFNYVKSLEESTAYRMEATFNRPGGTNVINNNPLFYGYNGLNHYSSSEKKAISDHMKKLGFHINPFYETYDGGSTAAINTFLGVKYILDDGGKRGNNGPLFPRNENPNNPYVSIPEYEEGYPLYKGELALPLGFVAHKQNATYISQGERREGHDSVYWFDDLEYQNQLFKTLDRTVVDGAGKGKNVFSRIPATYSVTEGVSFTEDEWGSRRYTGPKGSKIYVDFTLPEEAVGQNLYLGVKDTPNKFSFRMDGVTYRINDYFYSGIKGFEDTASHKHRLVITFNEDVINALVRDEIYYENLAVLEEYLVSLGKGGAKNLIETKSLFSYGFEGTFDYEGGDSEFLFTLPFEKELHIYLDGQEKPLLKRCDIFSAISLEGIETGKHDIKVLYVDKPFVTGFVVSIAGLLLTVPALFFAPRLERRFKKKEIDWESSTHGCAR